MIVWGNGLRFAAQQGTQIEFLAKVEKDVEALLKGELKSDEISRSRYLPEEDFDDF